MLLYNENGDLNKLTTKLPNQKNDKPFGTAEIKVNAAARTAAAIFDMRKICKERRFVCFVNVTGKLPLFADTSTASVIADKTAKHGTVALSMKQADIRDNLQDTL